MSYSFNVRAATKEGAIDAATAKFREVIESQPIHTRDEHAVAAGVAQVVAVITADESKDISVSVNGYVSWSGPDGGMLPIGAEPVITHCSLQVAASTVVREA